jgi:hypothetical protein
LIFIEVLILGIVFASMTTTIDYIRLFGYIKIIRGLSYSYRSFIQLIEDLIDEIAVIRSRRLSIVSILPNLGEKYFTLIIMRAIIFDENCQLKGTTPWPRNMAECKR